MSYVRTPEILAKQSAAHRGWKHTPESKAKIGAAMLMNTGGVSKCERNHTFQ